MREGREYVVVMLPNPGEVWSTESFYTSRVAKRKRPPSPPIPPAPPTRWTEDDRTEQNGIEAIYEALDGAEAWIEQARVLLDQIEEGE
jgi:hypothetical protein